MIISSCHFPPKKLFSNQKGYLDDELDYRKQSLDHAHKVRTVYHVFWVTAEECYSMMRCSSVFLCPLVVMLVICGPHFCVSLSVSSSWRRCCLTRCSMKRRVVRCPRCWPSRTVIRWGKPSISGGGRSWVNYESEIRRYSERGWSCYNMLKRYLSAYIYKSGRDHAYFYSNAMVYMDTVYFKCVYLLFWPVNNHSFCICKHHFFCSKYEASVFSVAYLLGNDFPVSTEDKRAGRVDRDTETTDKGIRRKGNHIDHSSIVFFQDLHHHLFQ